MIAPLIALGYRREGEVSLLAFSLKQVRKAGLFFNEIHSSKLAFIPSLSGVPKRMAGRIEGIRTICPWGGRDRIHLIAWSPKLRFLGLGWSSNKLVGLEASYSGLLVGQAGPPSSHSSR